ncbi:MAG: hypothetical protein ACR2OH_09110 [Microthrixaceae bacterium]
MSARFGRRRHRRVLAVSVGVVIGLGAGMAAAASLGATGGVVDAGVVAVEPACTGTPNIAQAYVSYSVADGYWVNAVGMTSVGANCRAPDTYVLTLADDSAAAPQIAEWSGTAPGTASALLLAPALTDGAPVDFVNATSDSVRVFYVTESP